MKTASVTTTSEIRERIPATIEALEALCLRLREALQASVDEKELFAAELLLRELLTNAVCHGCGCDPGLEVRCTLRLSPGQLAATVEDDGKGFNWRAALDRRPDDRGVSGRGMAILRLYAATVTFNEAGNRVDLVRELGQQRSR
jgi:anti-sigma regulatory factor (Ser/Thr protein kinase)